MRASVAWDPDFPQKAGLPPCLLPPGDTHSALPLGTPVLLGPGVQGPDVMESLEANWAEGPALDCVHLRYFGHTKNPPFFSALWNHIQNRWF